MTNHICTPSPSLACAIEAVQRAADAVDQAVMTDGDTFNARLGLRAANDLLQQAKARQLQADQAAAAEARLAEQQAVADQASQTQLAFDQAVDVIKPVDGVSFEVPVMPPAVAATAAALAHAKAAATAAQPALATAMTARAAVANRIAPKVQLMAEIAARRAEGDERESDAPDVSLLEQDLAHLHAKLAPLQTQVAEASSVVAQRRDVVADLERALAAAQRKAELAVMAINVRSLEAHLVAQVRALRLEAEKRGLNNFASTFAPSQKLRDVANGIRI